MLRFALVGCGRIAKRHSELLGNNNIQGACLVAVCDIVEEKASKIGCQFSVPFFTNMHEMMQKVQVDVVVVLTESGKHAEHVIALASYGKHIIVEKPMALTLDDADAMIKACDDSGAKFFVVKQNRFNIPVVKTHQALKSGRFGKLVLGTMGNTALVKIEAEDTAVVTLRFKNGALGVIEATTATRPNDLEGSLSILGEGGTVEIGGFAVNKMKVWNFVVPEEGDDDVMDKYSVNPPSVYGFGHQAYYDHVLDCILNNKQQLVDGLVGRKSLELISAIYESIETGREVHLRFRAKQCRLGAG